LSQLSDLSRELQSAQMLIRFGFRIIILVAFASFGGIGFVRSFSALLWMSIVLSTVVAVIRRETPFGTALNYWDETVAYSALFCLAHGIEGIAG
jgi:hypothetical protein